MEQALHLLAWAAAIVAAALCTALAVGAIFGP
jgi:hypothetical protein